MGREGEREIEREGDRDPNSEQSSNFLLAKFAVRCAVIAVLVELWLLQIELELEPKARQRFARECECVCVWEGGWLP